MKSLIYPLLILFILLIPQQASAQAGFYNINTNSSSDYLFPDIVCMGPGSQVNQGCTISYLKQDRSTLETNLYTIYINKDGSPSAEAMITDSGQAILNRIEFDGSNSFYLVFDEGDVIARDINALFISQSNLAPIQVTNQPGTNQWGPSITTTGSEFQIMWSDDDIVGFGFGILDKTPSLKSSSTTAVADYANGDIKYDKTKNLILGVYNRGEDIYGIAFDTNGNVAIPETLIEDNAGGTLVTFSPRLSKGSEASGKFLATWEENDILYGKLLTISNNQIVKTNPTFQLSSGAIFIGPGSSAYDSATGNFLITWNMGSDVLYNVVKFNPDGSPATIKQASSLDSIVSSNTLNNPVSVPLKFANGFGIVYEDTQSTGTSSLKLAAFDQYGNITALSLLSAPGQAQPSQLKASRVTSPSIEAITSDSKSFKISLGYLDNSTNNQIQNGICEASFGSPINKNENMTFASDAYKTSTINITNTTTFPFFAACSHQNYTKSNISVTLTVSIGAPQGLSIEYTAPQQSMESKDTNNITFSAKLTGNPDKAELWINGEKKQEKTSPGSSVSFTLNDLANGKYNWNIRLTKGSEEKSGDARSFTISFSTSPPSEACNESKCGNWGPCSQDGKQTRVCLDSKCSEEGKTERACVSIEPAKICKPAETQCSGNESQLCSDDGSEWETLENCRYGCNATAGACNPKPAQASGGGFDPTLIIIIAVIAVAGAAAFYFFYWRKRQPAEDEGEEGDLYPEGEETYEEEGQGEPGEEAGYEEEGSEENPEDAGGDDEDFDEEGPGDETEEDDKKK